MNLSSVQKIEKKRGQLSFSLQKINLSRSIRGSGDKASNQGFKGFGKKGLRRNPSRVRKMMMIGSGKDTSLIRKISSSELKNKGSALNRMLNNQSFLGNKILS